MNLDVPARDYMAERMAMAGDRAIDELLVLRCQAGRRDAFDMLFRRWQRRLWRYARSLTGNSDAAWDVTQEAWIAVLRQIQRLTDPAWFATWIHRIVRNKSADYHRRAGRRQQLAEGLAKRQKVGADPPDGEPADAVSRAVRRLPKEKQELLTLRYAQNLEIVEIAVVLGIPAGTVKSRLHNVREQLRVILEGDKS